MKNDVVVAESVYNIINYTEFTLICNFLSSFLIEWK